MRRTLSSLIWRLASLGLDVFVAIASFLAAFAVVFSTQAVPSIPGIVEKTVSFAVVAIAGLLVFGVHRASWRFVSLPEAITLVKVTVFTVIIYTVGAFFVSRGDNVPRSVPVLTGFLMVAALVWPRVIYRLAVEGRFFLPVGGLSVRDGLRHVVVVGFTNAAESFIRGSRRRDSLFRVVALLDDDTHHRSRSVQGVRVFGTLDDLAKLVEVMKARGTPLQDVVVAEQNVSRKRLSEIVQRANEVGLLVKRVPEVSDAASALFDPKPIELRDLLGRAEVSMDMVGVGDLIRGRTVLVSGAGGSIGSELVRQIAGFEPKMLVLADNSEHNSYMLDKELGGKHPGLNVLTRLVSVRDRTRVFELLREIRPQVVFHAAALKHVPLVEANPLEGIKTNVIGTRNVVDASLASAVSTFIMISTDKAVNPTNIMGATKRAAEAYCQAMDLSSTSTRFKTVRFGNVLGSNGSVVPRFEEQIRSGGPVTVTHPDIVRYFMTIPEAVRLVLHASSQALSQRRERGTIMVLDMGQPVRIVDLAERMIQLAGYKPNVDIPIVFSGLRPGEKLYEELFDPEEVRGAKTLEGFVLASPRSIDKASLLQALDHLEASVRSEKADTAIMILRRIVPEYRVPEAIAPVDEEPVMQSVAYDDASARVQAG
jgi:FlaA1/EpsC-like NDP-sugar epimerase